MTLKLIWNVCPAWVAFVALAGLVLLMLFVLPAHAQSRDDNLVSGSGSATGTGATTIISAPTATRRIYVTGVACGRTDWHCLDDLVVPNTGGGGGNNVTFRSPLIVPDATALTFTASSGVTTLHCNAQGFTGN
jgi:hypothetical protein